MHPTLRSEVIDFCAWNAPYKGKQDTKENTLRPRTTRK